MTSPKPCVPYEAFTLKTLCTLNPKPNPYKPYPVLQRQAGASSSEAKETLLRLQQLSGIYPKVLNNWIYGVLGAYVGLFKGVVAGFCRDRRGLSKCSYGVPFWVLGAGLHFFSKGATKELHVRQVKAPRPRACFEAHALDHRRARKLG